MGLLPAEFWLILCGRHIHIQWKKTEISGGSDGGAVLAFSQQWRFGGTNSGRSGCCNITWKIKYGSDHNNPSVF